MKGLFAFFTYNNAVPLTVMFVMLGAASTYAATNPESIVGTEERVISIDNTYIANMNLENYSPEIEILSVREDDEFYYVTYEFTTIALQDYVWQDVVSEKELRVPKRALGEYRDLGTYVTEELNELIKSEIARLKETQVFEKRQVSQKQVATAYSGLVGGFLNDKVDTVPGYEPKRREPEVEEQTFARPDPAAVAAMERGEQIEEPGEEVPPVEEPTDPVDPVATTTPDIGGDDDTPATTTDPVDDTNGTSTDDGGDDAGDDGQGSGGGGDTQTPINTKPKLTILGDNPARVEVGGTYTDLGATVTDDRDTDLTVDVYLNGTLVNKVNINTSATGTHTILYEATDLDGAVAQKTRTVEVYDPGSADNSDEPTTDGDDPDTDSSEDTDDTETDDTTGTSTDDDATGDDDQSATDQDEASEDATEPADDSSDGDVPDDTDPSSASEDEEESEPADDTE